MVERFVNEYGNTHRYNWAIARKESGEAFGGISVSHLDERICAATVSFYIGREWWRKGYASEALSAVIKFLFEQVGVNRIDGRHDIANPNSAGVMLKCGMSFEGVLRKCGKNSAGLCDVGQYAILAEDYFNPSSHR